MLLAQGFICGQSFLGFNFNQIIIGLIGAILLISPLSGRTQIDQFHPLDRSSFLPTQLEIDQCKLMAELEYSQAVNNTYNENSDTLELRHFWVDEMGRLKRLSIKDSHEVESDYRQFGYDEGGRLIGVAGLGSRAFDVELKYDRLGRLSMESDRNEGLYYTAKSRRYTYGRDGNVRKVVEVYLSYNLVYKATYKEDRLVKVTIEGNGPAYDRQQEDIEREMDDQKELPKLFGGLNCEYQYGDDGRVSKVVWTFTGAENPTRTEDYFYDDTGRLTYREIVELEKWLYNESAFKGTCSTDKIEENYYYLPNGLLSKIDRVNCTRNQKPEGTTTPYTYHKKKPDGGPD